MYLHVKSVGLRHIWANRKSSTENPVLNILIEPPKSRPAYFKYPWVLTWYLQIRLKYYVPHTLEPAKETPFTKDAEHLARKQWGPLLWIGVFTQHAFNIIGIPSKFAHQSASASCVNWTWAWGFHTGCDQTFPLSHWRRKQICNEISTQILQCCVNIPIQQQGPFFTQNCAKHKETDENLRFLSGKLLQQ